MAKQLTIDIELDSLPEERESTRIRAFLAKVKPMSGVEVHEDYWEARSLVEALALAFETGDQSYRWSIVECARVADFLHWIEPTKGSCFCDDDSRVNATCGFHAILEFMADELRRSAALSAGVAFRAKLKKSRKRAA